MQITALQTQYPMTVAIQGYPGSFHDQAARTYWDETGPLTLLPADTFDDLAVLLHNGTADAAVMAIENSIAGTILQNYRILREYGFQVTGELYLRIRHQLLGARGSSMSDVKRVVSHPMALHQCLRFLDSYPDWIRMESLDTALSAMQLRDSGDLTTACIASKTAASHYDLSVLAENIETHPHNYTRFFILHRNGYPYSDRADKASLYIRIPDKKGQLLQVLKWIEKCDLNMSQLQSYPVPGSPREYFFHLDVEFDKLEQYHQLKMILQSSGFEVEQTGVYQRGQLADIYNLASPDILKI